jgi:hypothetical protein
MSTASVGVRASKPVIPPPGVPWGAKNFMNDQLMEPYDLFNATVSYNGAWPQGGFSIFNNNPGVTSFRTRFQSIGTWPAGLQISAWYLYITVHKVSAGSGTNSGTLTASRQNPLVNTIFNNPPWGFPTIPGTTSQTLVSMLNTNPSQSRIQFDFTSISQRVSRIDVLYSGYVISV